MGLADDLIAARALIDTTEKWIKHKFEDDGCYCALGAVSMAATGRAHFDKMWFVGNAEKAAAALCAQLPARFAYVSDYNDDPATTHNDILALFDRAIASSQEPKP